MDYSSATNAETAIARAARTISEQQLALMRDRSNPEASSKMIGKLDAALEYLNSAMNAVRDAGSMAIGRDRRTVSTAYGVIATLERLGFAFTYEIESYMLEGVSNGQPAVCGAGVALVLRPALYGELPRLEGAVGAIEGLRFERQIRSDSVPAIVVTGFGR